LLEPVLAEATAGYGYARGAFPRVMLARMAPGGVIHPHRDQNQAAKWPHKIHVPLTTNEQVTFYVDGAGYHLGEGEAVEVNNMGVHAVENRGATDRIHLIFEYYDLDQPEPAWLADLQAQAASPGQ
jgi:aspartyl/asparaginyl beta-hydroxylase (cupin superfamily)